MKDIIEKLKNTNKFIATMESCTGGRIVDEITSIKGASSVLKFSCVTYNNDFKIKMGVSSELIEKFTVYSSEVAKDMAYNISKFTDSDFGIGITGNLTEVNDIVYIAIYIKENDCYESFTFSSESSDRIENKNIICNLIIRKLKTIV